MASPANQQIQIRSMQKQIRDLEKQAKELQDRADEHNNAIFLLFTIIALIDDCVDVATLGTLGAILTAPIPWLINGFFLTYRRDVWRYDDLLFSCGMSILEMLPIGDILPGTTAMVIERWWRSALAARADEDDANDKQKQADRIRRRMQRMIQLNNAIPFRQKIQAEQEPNTQQYLQGSTQSNSDAYDDYEDEEEEE